MEAVIDAIRQADIPAPITNDPHDAARSIADQLRDLRTSQGRTVFTSIDQIASAVWSVSAWSNGDLTPTEVCWCYRQDGAVRVDWRMAGYARPAWIA